MKKLIIAFVIFCVLAGSAFAQLSFSGEAYAGVQLEKSFVDSEDEVISANHRKENMPKFDFAAIAARDNYGIKLDTTFQVASDPANILALNGIYGWADFLDKSIRLAIGKISDAAWVSVLDADHEMQFDEGMLGFRVTYKTPLEGLSVGVALPTEDYNLDKFAKQMMFGANYVNPLFNAVATYDLGSNGRTIFGFNYTGIDALTSAGVQLRATNLATFNSPAPGYGGAVEVNEKIGYRLMRPLIVSLVMEQIFYGAPDTDAELAFIPSVSYRLIPGLTASLAFGIRSKDLFETQIFTLNPCLEYTLKGPALLYVEYELTLAQYKSGSSHRFGFGIDVKAF